MSPAPVWRRAADIEALKAAGDLDVDFDKLVREGYESLQPQDYYRLKTWGVCSQNKQGVHMIRIRIPGGIATAGQLDAIAALSDECADGMAHVTTRTNLELHSVATGDLLQVMEALHEVGLTTRSACGHTVRNVLGCSASGICSEEIVDTRPWVRAVHELVVRKAEEFNSRLPRRLNVSFAGCGACSHHAQVNDIGFVATAGPGAEPGFAVWLAGSLGTNPRISEPLCAYVKAEHAVAVVEAIVGLYADHGFRDKPAKARLKYLVEEWGIERVRVEFALRFQQLTGTRPVFGEPYMPPEPADSPSSSVLPQRQPGRYRVRVHVSIGEATSDQLRALAALSREEADGCVRFTPEQNAELAWVAEAAISRVLAALSSAGLTSFGSGDISDVRACPGTTHCVLATADSQGAGLRIQESFIASPPTDDAVRRMRVHISGCPNSCAQHQACDIGLAGCRTKIDGEIREGFQVFVGGRLGRKVRTGTRIGRVDANYADAATRAVTELFLTEREPDEQLADVVDRLGAPAFADRLAAMLPGAAGNFGVEAADA